MASWFTKAVGYLTGPSFRLTDSFAGRLLSGTMTSSAGKYVSVDAAMNLTTVSACVRLVAQTISTLPLQTFYVAANGDRELARDADLYALLHDKPNADMTAVEYWETVMSHLLMWGNSVSEIGRVGARIVAITPLRPDYSSRHVRPDGTVFFRYLDIGRTREIEEADVLHIKGFSFDGRWGMSPLGCARHSIGAALAADEAAATVFKNGMRPSGTLSTDVAIAEPERARLRQTLQEFTGSENTGKVLVLGQGLKWAPLSFPPEEAQLLQTRQFNVEEQCRWFGVPPWMIGHSSGSSATTGTGLEQHMLSFLTLTLRPWLIKIEQAVMAKLIPAGQRGRIVVSFNADALMRTDSAGKSSLYAAYVQNGIRTRNEVRALDNLPRIDGADELTAQSNLAPLNKLGAAVGKAPGEPVSLPGGGDPPIRQ